MKLLPVQYPPGRDLSSAVVFRFVAWGLRPASLAFGGFAIGTFGPRAALWTMTAGMLVVAVAAAFSPLRYAGRSSEP